MREFRIKVNNEKTYVVKANDYNQAVKTLHSKLRDFDLTNFLALKRSLELRIGEEIDFDKLEEYVNKLPKDKNGKKNINVKEVIKCCIKAKDNAVSDSISKYNGEDAIRTNGFVKIKEDGDWTSYKYNGSDFDGAVFKIHQYNPSLIAFVSNGNRTITVRNKYLNDADYTAQGEIEVLKSFGFDYKDGKWVKESNNSDIIVQPDYHYVSVIGPGDTEKHCKKYQYQSAGMLKKIIASNIKDSSITDADMKIAEDIIKKYGGNPVGNVMGLQKTRFVGQDEIKNQHDFATDLDKAGYKFYLINGRYRISPKDSSIKDVSYVSGKNLKIGQKIVEDGEVLEVVDIKETQRGVNNNYRDVTFKNVKTGATETVHFVNSALARLNDNSPKYSKGQKFQTSVGIHEIIGYDPVIADVNTNRIEYSYRLKTPNGTYTNIPDWQLEESVKQGRYKLIDSNISDKLIESGSKKALSKNIATEIKAGKDTKQAAAIAYSVQRENDASTGYKFRITNNGSKWYYETTFPDGHTTLTGPYLSRQETEQYFHKHRPTEKLTDAEPVKVEKIIRKEKSALGITYYLFQTKSSSGATIYYEVTDKTYHGEPTYSGGGIVSFSLKTANDSLDSHLLSDKLKAKYGEKEGTKRFLRGENDSAINDKLSTSDANSLVEAYIDKYKYTHSNLPYVNKPKIKIFNSPEEFRDKFLSSYRGYSIFAGGLLNYNGYVVKLFTSAKDGKIESPSVDNIFTIFPTTAIKDSANSIKNRISYDDLKRTINKVMEEGNDKDVVNILIGQLSELKKDYETDINNSKLDKEETKRHYGEYKRLVNNYKNSQISKEYTRAVNSFLSAIKDSNNIKNRKSYTIKVGDKQYKVFAESESEAINKYIKSKKQ